MTPNTLTREPWKAYWNNWEIAYADHYKQGMGQSTSNIPITVYCAEDKSNMDINKLDFTPHWHCGGHGEMLLSQDECTYLGRTWEDFMGDSKQCELSQYADRLATYWHRFGTHMPPEMRKMFLLDLHALPAAGDD